MPGIWAQRGIAAAVLLPSAALSLPVAATFLDHPPGRENWIFPAQLATMAGIGAATGALLPGLVSSTASRGKGAVVGAALGVGAAVLADVGLFALIAG